MDRSLKQTDFVGLLFLLPLLNQRTGDGGNNEVGRNTGLGKVKAIVPPLIQKGNMVIHRTISKLASNLLIVADTFDLLSNPASSLRLC